MCFIFTECFTPGLPSSNRYPVNRRNNVHLVDSPHLSYDQISTLSKCLADPLALDEFLKFAYKEFSDAVVQFYIDVERYEVINHYLSLFFVSQCSYFYYQEFPSIEFACQIFSKYLSDTSEEEVDADPKVKKNIWQQLQHGMCPADLFSSLKGQVYAVMVQDNFLRFQNHIISTLAMI